jgi:hypothetical protein
MDYAPPGRVVRVCESRWDRFVIRDGRGLFWAGKNRWSRQPAEAVLFYTEIDAIEVRNRHCLGDAADTFTVTAVVTAHAGRWSADELAAYLKKHRKLSIVGHGGRKGLLLELLSDTLRKVEP